MGRDWSAKNQSWYMREGPHFRNTMFFRNNTKDGIVNAYKFGINITVYLLTRFQDKFMTLPKGAG